jgi:signal transduction histidine kinase
MSGESVRPRPRLARKAYKIILLTVAIATTAFALATILDLAGYVLSSSELGSLLRFSAQTTVVVVSLGVFFIQWLPPKQEKTAQSIFIASAFLAVGFLSFAHILTCSMTSAIIATETPMGSFFHMMIGVTMAAALLIAAFIPSQRTINRADSYKILLAFLLYVCVVAVAALLFGSAFPSLCPHDARADPVRIVVEIGVIIGLVVATAKYYLIAARTKDAMFTYLTMATALGAYTHAAFCLHTNPHDPYSVLSTVLTIASFGCVFLALFSTSVTQPYTRLTKAREQAERRRKEAEAATVKAQTYLDFLSHDIANMISPIMGRAEMISMSQGASEEQKEEALKIVDQTHKIASLIVNLRRLSRTERIDAGKLGEVDLRVLLPDLKNARKNSYPDKNLTVKIQLPEDTLVKVLGGSAAEEIIEEILDNAVKHGGKDSVMIEIDVHPAHGDLHRRFWDIVIQDHGTGIPDHTKATLNIASSDPEKRFTRGVASSLSIMSLVAEALGGRIRIEDRVPKDHTQGTKVTITLPRAQ